MNINRVVLSGNLTKDPDLRSTGGGTSVCKMRIAVNTRRKDNATGEWGDKANYFNVTVFGRQAESCAQYLTKGRPIAVDGRLEWSEWEADGQKRQSVDVVAENVQFLGGRDEGGSRQESDIPADVRDMMAPGAAAAGATADDSDIPF